MNTLRKFKSWYKAAKKDYPFDHTAFNLSTSYNNRPYSRMVLLKKILPDGFIFFTNLTSNKGKHFKSNKTLSMCFYWESLKKQIRISDDAKIEDDALSKIYLAIENGGAARNVSLSEEEKSLLQPLGLLTYKPIIYACNLSEDELKEGNIRVR